MSTCSLPLIVRLSQSKVSNTPCAASLNSGVIGSSRISLRHISSRTALNRSVCVSSGSAFRMCGSHSSVYRLSSKCSWPDGNTSHPGYRLLFCFQTLRTSLIVSSCSSLYVEESRDSRVCGSLSGISKGTLTIGVRRSSISCSLSSGVEGHMFSSYGSPYSNVWRIHWVAYWCCRCSGHLLALGWCQRSMG